MGKKNVNPADAYRKAQRKKELKKNKAGRAKTRDLAIVKQDTTELEEVIKEFEESRSDQVKLAELKAELEKINKKKAEYVAEHPEARRLVYRRRKQGEQEPELPTKKARNFFNKNGLPRHPERSLYYHPVMNPFGVAPPGLAYIERPLLPGEVDSEADSEDDDEPPGLPPGAELITSEDDIQMPEGPPPGKEDVDPTSPPEQNPLIQNAPTWLPPPPMPQGVPLAMTNLPFPPPPPPPPGFSMPGVPMPLLPSGMALPATFPGWTVPPMQNPVYTIPPFPYPPPNTLPRRQNPSSVQDPLSSLPHQTFQAHRASQLFPPQPLLPDPATKTPSTPTPSSSSHHSSLPPKPTAAAKMAAATIEAAPELRDLHKEAVTFVPTAVRRKRPEPPVPVVSTGQSLDADGDGSEPIGPQPAET